jgi:hypothetical protein
VERPLVDSRSLLLDPLRSSLRAGAIQRERTSLAPTNRQMTNDEIAYLRLLADWHTRQARYLLLTVPDGQHDKGRFHFTAAARLSRLADEATMSRSG